MITTSGMTTRAYTAAAIAPENLNPACGTMTAGHRSGGAIAAGNSPSTMRARSPASAG
jgi:hypothetical protein